MPFRSRARMGPPYGYRGRAAPRRGSFMGPRMWIGLGLVAFAFLSYQCSTEYNSVTGEEQHLSLAPQQEIAGPAGHAADDAAVRRRAS